MPTLEFYIGLGEVDEPSATREIRRTVLVPRETSEYVPRVAT